MLADIRFDDDTATRLEFALESVTDVLQSYGNARREVANIVMEEFAGHYARLFVDACEAEIRDRVKLFRVIDGLKEWICSARQAAEDEQPLDGLFVRQIVAPHHVSALIMIFERVRHGHGSSGGKSSAQPEALRIFERVSSRYTGELRSELEKLKVAFSRFDSECSSAIIYGWQGFVSTLAHYNEENHLDGAWMARVADAFEEAGSGQMLDAGITATMLGGRPVEFSEFLFNEDLTIEEVHVAWLTFVDQQGNSEEQINRFIEKYCFELASLDGIPFAVQDQAGRAALEEIGTIPKNLPVFYDPEFHRRLESARQRMGLPPIIESSDIERVAYLNIFALEIQGVHEALARAGSGNEIDVQLVGFGGHGEAVTAGVALGDLDTASNITVLVPGMDSSTAKMSGPIPSLKKFQGDDFEQAVMVWNGYDSPNISQVMWNEKAKAGGKQLVNLLKSLDANNANYEQLNLLGHSYGTNVVTEASKASPVQISNAIMYGSAGIGKEIEREDLNVDEIWVTEAKRDTTAPWGRKLGRLDPAELEDVTEFSSEDSSYGVGVTGHSLIEKDGVGYFDIESSPFKTSEQILTPGEVPKKYLEMPLEEGPRIMPPSPSPGPAPIDPMG